MMRYLSIFWLACLGISEAQAAPLESFEDKFYWQVANWGDEAKSGVSSEQVSVGDKSFEIHFAPEMANRGKGIVLERDLSSLGQEFSRVTLDVYNKGPAKISVALAFETDEYYESQAVPLEKGWNKNISFMLRAKVFKSKASNWQYETSVNLGSPLKKMFVLFYRDGGNEGTFFVDNLQIFQDAGTDSEQQGAPSRVIERSKKNHYRPRGLPIEIFIRS